MSKELAALQRAGMTDAVQSGIGKAGAARTATELILRERPDGKSYARDIADKYGLSIEKQ